jgi:hypothetical protein
MNLFPNFFSATFRSLFSAFFMQNRPQVHPAAQIFVRPNFFLPPKYLPVGNTVTVPEALVSTRCTKFASV